MNESEFDIFLDDEEDFYYEDAYDFDNFDEDNEENFQF